MTSVPPITITRDVHLMVATPLVGGAQIAYLQALTGLAEAVRRQGFALSCAWIEAGASPDRARNALVGAFMASRATHLLLVDGDVGFAPDEVLGLVDLMHEDPRYAIMAAATPQRHVNWPLVAMAAAQGLGGENPAQLERFSGQFALEPAQLVEALWARATGAASPLPPAAETVLWNIRLPRIAAGVAVGAMLAAAGAAYQGMFRNPLVSPDILGVSAGAGLGAVIAIYLGLSMFAVQWLAFGGGLIAVAVVVAISACVRRHDPVLVLVLAGIALGALLEKIDRPQEAAQYFRRAANAALHLIATLAGTDAGLHAKLVAFRARQTQVARDMKVPPEA